MGWIVAATIMLGVSAESTRLDGNDVAMRAGTVLPLDYYRDWTEGW